MSKIFASACLGLSVMLTALNSSGQTNAPANQFVYSTGILKLPPWLAASPNLLFSGTNGLFEFRNLAVPTEPTIYLSKPPGQHGIYIVDNNQGDNTVLYHSLNIELYNITNLAATGTRAGIRVHVDPSNTVSTNLFGIEVGNHGASTAGLVVLTGGVNGEPTSGIGIESLSSGTASILTTEGDNSHTTLPTIGAQFNHYTTGHILSLYQSNSAMTGDFIFGNASNGGLGTLTGNFINFNVNYVPKFRVDAVGNLSAAGSIWSLGGFYLGSQKNAAIYYNGTDLVLEPRIFGAGNVVTGSGTMVIPAIKANSGTRFVCVDTAGVLMSQTVPCSGT